RHSLHLSPALPPSANYTLSLHDALPIYATLNGRELAVASYLSDHLLPLLIGRDARRIEDTWQYLYKGAYWRRGPVTMTAIAAVEDRKSTRLNSSHVAISYAVFCLKKKNK